MGVLYTAGVGNSNKTLLENIESLTDILDTPGPGRANSIYYECDLGDEFTDEQSEDIQSGAFDIVRVGCYWTINGTKYWCAHADYRYNQNGLATHHMLVVPDTYMGTAKMFRNVDYATGGYTSSYVKGTALSTHISTVKTDFGSDHILTYNIVLNNAVNGYSPGGSAWYTSQMDLLTEPMIHGHPIWSNNWDSGYTGYLYGSDPGQLALFRYRPDLIAIDYDYWLRDWYSIYYWNYVSAEGAAECGSVNTTRAVRPCFCVY